MISKFGNNLTVVLVAKPTEDWEAFSSWYSVQKNLPYSKILLTYIREEDATPFQLFQWSKRVGVKSFGISSRKLSPLADYLACLVAAYNELGATKVLMLPAHCMVLDVLPSDVVEIFNSQEEKLLTDGALPILSTLGREALERSYNNLLLTGSIETTNQRLSCGAKDEESYPIVNYVKGCGKWIDTKKGCPFSSAGGLLGDAMTVNENRIIALWRKMAGLYSSVA